MPGEGRVCMILGTGSLSRHCWLGIVQVRTLGGVCQFCPLTWPCACRRHLLVSQRLSGNHGVGIAAVEKKAGKNCYDDKRFSSVAAKVLHRSSHPPTPSQFSFSIEHVYMTFANAINFHVSGVNISRGYHGISITAHIIVLNLFRSP